MATVWTNAVSFYMLDLIIFMHDPKYHINHIKGPVTPFRKIVFFPENCQFYALPPLAEQRLEQHE